MVITIEFGRLQNKTPKTKLKKLTKNLKQTEETKPNKAKGVLFCIIMFVL